MFGIKILGIGFFCVFIFAARSIIARFVAQTKSKKAPNKKMNGTTTTTSEKQNEIKVKKVNGAPKDSPVDTQKVAQLIKPNTSTGIDVRPPTINVEIDVVAWSLFALALVSRMWRLDYPKQVVFDELHYGKFVSLYMKGIFFFDSQPPLGKQLIALAGYFSGYDGNNDYTSIGGAYSDEVPLKSLRFVPALFGCLIIPVVYHFTVELGLTYTTAFFTAFFVIIENSILTQSRFMLMDTMLIFFSFFGLFAILKFRKKQLFCRSWFSWLFLSTTFLTFALSVKFIGFMYLLLALTIVAYDFWWLIPDKSIKTISFFIQAFVYFLAFIVWPLMVYCFIFYIHLSLLTKAGPHDNIMTSAFQASLEGGLASITKGQPLEIAHGSLVTLRHTHGRTCWIHSHDEVYPVRYNDKRGSSHQQQVTCYSFKDVNNWWIVKDPNTDDLVAANPITPIMHGDIIQLVHGISSRTLNSHDVAGPVSPQHQEVSCYIDYNISMPAQNLWKVDLVNGEETGFIWHTIRSKVRFIHVNSSQALKFSGKQLPDWGFNQHEMVTDRVVDQDDTVWNVEEHRYVRMSDEKERERDMVGAEFVPLSPTKMSFWKKMRELQYKMFTFDQEAVKDHVYACDSPLDWIYLTKGIAYWVHTKNNAQIHLIGNLFLWYNGVFFFALYIILLTFYLMRRRRHYFDIPDEYWVKFTDVGRICVIGYILHLLPYFCTEQSLFLHHYLPAIIFKLVVISAVTEHFGIIFKNKNISFLILTIILLCALYVFTLFLPLSYGIRLKSTKELINLKWLPTWQFIVHQD